MVTAPAPPTSPSVSSPNDASEVQSATPEVHAEKLEEVPEPIPKTATPAAKLPIAEPAQMASVREMLGIDAATPLAKAVEQANQMMGIEGVGELSAQVALLAQQLSIGEAEGSHHSPLCKSASPEPEATGATISPSVTPPPEPPPEPACAPPPAPALPKFESEPPALAAARPSASVPSASVPAQAALGAKPAADAPVPLGFERRRSSSSVARGPFAVVAHGGGGIEELRSRLDEREVMFGLLRATIGSGALARTKYVLGTFRGAQCGAMRAMRATARRDEASSLLGGGATVAFGCEHAGGATVDALLEALLRTCVADDGGAPSLSAAKADLERQIAAAQSALRERNAREKERRDAARHAPSTPTPMPLPRARVGSLKEALSKLRAPTGPINWLAVSPQLQLLAAGGGSVGEMAGALAADEVAFGLLRVAFGAGSFRRCYWLFVHWTGPECSALRRGQANVQRGAALALLQQGGGLTLSVGAADELSAEAVIEKVRKCAAVDEDLACGDVESVCSRQAFFQAVHEDAAAVYEDLGLEAPAAAEEACEVEEEAAQGGGGALPELSVEEAVRAVRADDDPINWVLIAEKPVEG